MGVEPVLIWAIPSSEVRGIARFHIRTEFGLSYVCTLEQRKPRSDLIRYKTYKTLAEFLKAAFEEKYIT